ncbi:MAG: hypothetical protein GWP59_04200 [Chlamydiales bacterium]|nr:hypothetical protein [Chlamydiales bacterium]
MTKTLSKIKRKKLLFSSLLSPIIAGFILLLVLLIATPSLQRVHSNSTNRLIQTDIQRSMDFLFAEAINPSTKFGTSYLSFPSVNPLSGINVEKYDVQLIKEALNEESSNSILIEMKIKVLKNSLIIYEQTRYASYSK